VLKLSKPGRGVVSTRGVVTSGAGRIEVLPEAVLLGGDFIGISCFPCSGQQLLQSGAAGVFGVIA
jgi:hypothetical protein